MYRVIDHPLVRHRVTVLRDAKTNSKLFRDTLSEITTFLAYEALRDLPTVRRKISTPIAQTHGEVLNCRVVIVPIIRAGVAMTDAMLNVLPEAVVGFLGVRRNDVNAQPAPYYANLPACCGDEWAILLDPMLATGGTACSAITQLKRLGYRRIRFLNLIATQTGIDRIEREHPDVVVHTAAVDTKLNEHFYIVPGLGDAGDRLYATATNSSLSKLMHSLEAKILSDGRVDMAEAGELLRLVSPIAGSDEDFAIFRSELESVRSDGIIDPIESDRIAKMIAALADKSESLSVVKCAACGRPVSVRTIEDDVLMCPWCGQSCTK